MNLNCIELQICISCFCTPLHYLFATRKLIAKKNHKIKILNGKMYKETTMGINEIPVKKKNTR